MNQVWRFLRRWLVRAALNVALLTGLFFAAAALERVVAPWWPEISFWPVITAAVVWAGTALLALPPLLTGAHKLKAAAILFAESRVPATSPRQTWLVRATVAGALLLLGTQALALWLLWLVTTLELTEPWPPLLALLVLFALVAAHVWRAFLRFYGGFRVPARPREAPSRAAAFARLMHDWPVADLDLVTFPGTPSREKPPSAGQVKHWTGARVAGIVRAGKSITNPGADQQLRAGDQVLLAGAAHELAAARRLLAEGRLPSPGGETAAPA